ncbi:MAG: hypothetical protein R3360_04855, partial [Alphaproteobacteria bacterium]|nr:hypothetical protein [Alphaproteobacteria bacterium]
MTQTVAINPAFSKPGPVPDLPNLAGQSRDELADLLRSAGVPEKQIRMRVQQLWQWVYNRGVTDLAQTRGLVKFMGNLNEGSANDFNRLGRTNPDTQFLVMQYAL